MSKEIAWSMIHGEGDIVCSCDKCGNEHEVPFEDGCFDFRDAQEEIKSLGWISRKINNEWYDFCSSECYQEFLRKKG